MNERGDRSVCYHHKKSDAEDQPELDIVQRLPDLGDLEVLVSNARVILLHAWDGNVSLAATEAPRSNGVCWHKEKNHEGPEYGDRARNKIYVLPGVEAAAADMSKSVIDEGRHHG